MRESELKWWYADSEYADWNQFGGFTKESAILEGLQQGLAEIGSDGYGYFYVHGGVQEIMKLGDMFSIRDWWEDVANDDMEIDNPDRLLSSNFSVMKWWQWEAFKMSDRFWEDLDDPENLMNFFTARHSKEEWNRNVDKIKSLNARILDIIIQYEDKYKKDHVWDLSLITESSTIDDCIICDNLPYINILENVIKGVLAEFEDNDPHFHIDPCLIYQKTPTYEVKFKKFTGLRYPFKSDLVEGIRGFRQADRYVVESVREMKA